ncbi:hypothetical protein HMPREF9153_0956 [Cutibacterium avidum ATCC 25577]|uniref:Uncharacterized protein n=1 Tax=Cutibacterium avidum ATCC 25577 TaxID=997355 RepID=G4CWP9_9ACTN|nr:hypothetical protein HMPREF9153_0956 [Cutibacterium avidum ATCC 25577]
MNASQAASDEIGEDFVLCGPTFGSCHAHAEELAAPSLFIPVANAGTASMTRPPSRILMVGARGDERE